MLNFKWQSIILTLIVCTGCPSFNFVGIPDSIPKENICGSTSNCGLSGRTVFAEKDIPIAVYEPRQTVGMIDNHGSKDWLFGTPESCDSVKISNSDYKLVKLSSTIIKNVEKKSFASGLKAEIEKEISSSVDVIDAEAKAAIERVLEEVNATEIKFESFIVSINNIDKINELKRECQDAENNRYIRRQALFIRISGSSKNKLKRKILTSLEAKAELKPESVVSESLGLNGEAGASIKYENEIKNAIDSYIDSNVYTIAVSYDAM